MNVRLSLAVHRLAFVLSIAVVGLEASAFSAEDKPALERGAAVLHLADGSFVRGDLAPSAWPGVVSWQAEAFVSPFEFPIERVSAVHWPAPPAAIARPAGEHCFELSGGDVLFGRLVALDGQHATLDIPRIGRLEIERGAVHRIYRWHASADLVYLGPNGLAGWRAAASPRGANRGIASSVGPNSPPRELQPAPIQSGWHEESGQLVTDREGTAIEGDFRVPPQAVIEFEISWKAKPDFVFALGIDGNDMGTIKRAFRFEAWGSDLVVERELENDADLAVVQEISPGPGRAHLQAYLDQEAGRIVVCAQGGRQLASLKLAGARPQACSGLYLANLRGDLRLEWLRIGKWSGELPREVNVRESRIHRADGSIIYGEVVGFDAASGEFLVRGKSGESRVRQDQISGVFLSLPGDDRPRPLRVVYQDGTRLSGELERVETGTLLLKVPGIARPARLPAAGLRSLVILRHPDQAPLPRSGATGRLELEGLRLPGQLADGRARAGASCLVWLPLASTKASALAPGASGRIVYREPPQPATVTIYAGAPAGGVRRRTATGALLRPARNADSLLADEKAPSTRERKALYLRDGDVIPSVITGIDSGGVWFKTSLSKNTFVPHAKVQAIELANDPPDHAERTVTLPNGKVATVFRTNDLLDRTDRAVLTTSKREKLLTLPRMQKANPPTHLVHSRNGDYLRGRVLSMNAKALEIEVRLETKQVPRERISRIIWLHPEALTEAKRPTAPSTHEICTRVQVLRNDGARLTFRAEHFAGTILSGTSDVLGACAVAVSDMDQLYFGAAIDQVATGLAYHQWKLTNAPEPKYVTAPDGAGSDTGTESALVGKPAPDFTLELLEGKPFHLAESKGKEVVVLDFWATWCGPCVQAMPQVERAVHAFKNQNVRLVAVNLQETAAQVKALLERLKLNVSVAFDRDGAIAGKYGAVAIPQTVVIRRDGSVARVFVGGGSRLENQLKEAIHEAIEGSRPKAAAE